MGRFAQLRACAFSALVILAPAFANGQTTIASSQARHSSQGNAEQESSTIETLKDSRTGARAMIDRSGKGAVLCTWGITTAVQVVGQKCFAGKDRTFQAELQNSILKMERFIIANSSQHITQVQLDARKAEGILQLRQLGDVCKSEAVEMYTALRDRGPEAMRVATDDMLSIPREPVMNPCL